MIFSKNRLSPINQILTISRLELLGGLMGCRAIQFVGDQLGISIYEQLLFTDSECVIEGCTSIKDLKRFVRDKVAEIHKCDIVIGYISSNENPADVASRGQRPSKLKGNSLWWHGPEWLKQAETD